MSNLTRRAAAGLLASPAAFALIPATVLAKEADGPPVDGRNVTSVTTKESQFSLTPIRQWTERTRSGAIFLFTETGRDDTSVHLRDDSRGVRLQIDLVRALVLYADEGAPALRPLYPITRSSAEVNGFNLVSADVAGGRYTMTGPDAWIERGNDGVQFTFAEERRDRQSVHLVDASRGMRLRIDLRRNLVLYAYVAEHRMRPLYPLTGASAVAT